MTLSYTDVSVCQDVVMFITYKRDIAGTFMVCYVSSETVFLLFINL